LVAALAIVAALAGCVGDGGGQSVDPSPSPGVSDDAGAVQGAVLTDEGLPIGGAQVALLTGDASTTTAADGTYVLGDLAPGRVQLQVQKIGFEANVVPVEIVAGQVTRTDVVLAPVAVVEARHVTVIWRGFMACSISNELFLSEECGEGVGTPVGTFGKDPNNKIDYDFDLMEQPQTLLTETTWEPASTFAGAMYVTIVKNLRCEPVCESDKTYETVEGPSPVRVIVDGDSFPDDAGEYPLNTTVRHWAGRSDMAAGMSIILEQPFEVYKTEFFGTPIPSEDWSALPESS
jgi:hypothetical protein